MSGSGKVRGRMLLTVRAIAAFNPEAEPYLWKDTLVSSVALRVAPDGGKTWDLSYRIAGAGKVKRLSLGRYGDPGATLEEARDRAHELTAAARQGVDLIAQELEAREAKARSMTLGKLIDLYLASRVRPRLRSAPDIERTLRRVLAPLAAMSAADVRKRDLLPLFESISASGHERAAGKARVLASGLFKWAESIDVIAGDPTRGLPSYDQGTPRDRVLDEEDIRTLWAWLDTLPFAVADALRIQLLTGARIGEVSGMTAEEIDRDKWVWTLPGARSKNKRTRVTPLVGVARTIIAARIDTAGDGPLFVGETGKGLTSAAIGEALYARRARLPIGAFASHDLRRTVATEMYAMGITRDVIGAIVGHGSGDGDRGSRTLIRHYLKSDLIARKTHALEAWETRLKAIIDDDRRLNVVPLPVSSRR
jgi:integrase